MILDLKQLFELDGEELSFQEELDLSPVELWGIHPFEAPVQLKGSVRNRAGMVELSFRASYLLHTICSRCLQEGQKQCEQLFTHKLAGELNDQDNDEYVLVENFKLDLDELAASDILLELPIKTLCREDCKGLCPKCGANLNETDCGCDTRQFDPRLEALRKLLEN